MLAKGYGHMIAMPPTGPDRVTWTGYSNRALHIGYAIVNLSKVSPPSSLNYVVPFPNLDVLGELTAFDDQRARQYNGIMQ